MKHKLRNAFEHEMNLGKEMYACADYPQCYVHFERAHILGQRHFIPHVKSHYWMLKVGRRQGDVRETLGQAVRMVMSVFSLINTVPLGNTGRARINPLKAMPIPDDLIKYFD